MLLNYFFKSQKVKIVVNTVENTALETESIRILVLANISLLLLLQGRILTKLDGDARDAAATKDSNCSNPSLSQFEVCLMTKYIMDVHICAFAINIFKINRTGD